MTQFLVEIMKCVSEKLEAERQAKIASNELLARLEPRLREVCEVLKTVYPWMDDEIWSYGPVSITSFPYYQILSGNLNGFVYICSDRNPDIESSFPVSYLFSNDWIAEKKAEVSRVQKARENAARGMRDERYAMYLKLKEEFDGQG